MQPKTEEDAIEKELDKIDSQFIYYNRQRDKEQPAEQASIKKLVVESRY